METEEDQAMSGTRPWGWNWQPPSAFKKGTFFKVLAPSLRLTIWLIGWGGVKFEMSYIQNSAYKTSGKTNCALYRTSGIMTSRGENEVTCPLWVLLSSFLFTDQPGCVFILVQANLLFFPAFGAVAPLPPWPLLVVRKQPIPENEHRSMLMIT